MELSQRYATHLRRLIIPEKILGSGQARPLEVLSNFWFGSQKVRLVKKSIRILYLTVFNQKLKRSTESLHCIDW